jgi:uncharacterized membrane protein
MMESRKRSVVKGVAWRMLSTVNGFVVAIAILEDVSTSITITIVANITGLILYYIHERFWNGVEWERK